MPSSRTRLIALTSAPADAFALSCGGAAARWPAGRDPHVDVSEYPASDPDTVDSDPELAQLTRG